MAKFLTELDCHLLDDDKIWQIDSPLRYESDLIGCLVTVPVGFQTDFASVPRVPIAYMAFGDRAHRESVVHDYLYRIDPTPAVSRATADAVFREAMGCRGKPTWVRWAMWAGVRLGGWWKAYHQRRVGDKLTEG